MSFPFAPLLAFVLLSLARAQTISPVPIPQPTDWMFHLFAPLCLDLCAKDLSLDAATCEAQCQYDLPDYRRGGPGVSQEAARLNPNPNGKSTPSSAPPTGREERRGTLKSARPRTPYAPAPLARLNLVGRLIPHCAG